MGKPIVHFDLGAKDRQALGDFYEAVFDWNVTHIPEADYTLVKINEGILGGGIMTTETPTTIVYIEVDDIPAALADIEAKGGTTVQAETVIPDMVTYAMFTDPAGNTVGLVKSEAPA